MKKILPFIFLLITSATLSAQIKQKTYLMVHGAWHGAWYWDKVVPFMTSKGYKVLAIDLPGHGKDTTNPATISFTDYVNKVTEVTQGLNANHHRAWID